MIPPLSPPACSLLTSSNRRSPVSIPHPTNQSQRQQLEANPKKSSPIDRNPLASPLPPFHAYPLLSHPTANPNPNLRSEKEKTVRPLARLRGDATRPSYHEDGKKEKRTVLQWRNLVWKEVCPGPQSSNITRYKETCPNMLTTTRLQRRAHPASEMLVFVNAPGRKKKRKNREGLDYIS